MNSSASNVTTAARHGYDVNPTLLRIPAWYSDLAHDEVVLPLPPEDYDVCQSDTLWRVTVKGTGDLVYLGSGPVEVVRSRAPF